MTRGAQGHAALWAQASLAALEARIDKLVAQEPLPRREAMPTLYRGLEHKFDPNYDESITLPPSGYSHWTDNPELAREYAGPEGYVYQYDLPDEAMGESYIDESGERPLYYDNGGLAGLKRDKGKGYVKGKEYLVYQHHPDYDPSAIKLTAADQESLPEMPPASPSPTLYRGLALDLTDSELAEIRRALYGPDHESLEGPDEGRYAPCRGCPTEHAENMRPVSTEPGVQGSLPLSRDFSDYELTRGLKDRHQLGDLILDHLDGLGTDWSTDPHAAHQDLSYPLLPAVLQAQAGENLTGSQVTLPPGHEVNVTGLQLRHPHTQEWIDVLNEPSVRQARSKIWYHVTPAQLFPGQNLIPSGGQSPWPRHFETDEGHGGHVWMEHDLAKLAEWGKLLEERGYPWPHAYRVEPIEQPRPFQGDSSMGWIAPSAQVIEEVDYPSLVKPLAGHWKPSSVRKKEVDRRAQEPSSRYSATEPHRIRWYAYSAGDRIPHNSQMRGHWDGYDAACSCGWETRTGGATRQHVKDLVFDHKFQHRKTEAQARKKGGIVRAADRDAIFREAAEDYRTHYQAPGPQHEGHRPLHDLDPRHYKDLDFYVNRGRGYDAQTMDAIHGSRGNPENMVPIYRALPPGYDNINQGDWVSTSYGYAKDHARNKGGWPVISAVVRAADLWNDANSLQEWGYQGPTVPGKFLKRRPRHADTQTVLPGSQFVPTNEVSMCGPGMAYDPIHQLCVPYFPAINIPGYGQQCPDGYFYDNVHNICTVFPPVYPPPPLEGP